VYAEVVLPHGAPARTTVEVSGFRGRTMVEFDAVAVRSGH
jgi:2-iminobutanoate/2-iminopropanoate deaminase